MVNVLNIDKDGLMPVHLAAYHGHYKVVKFLIEECGVEPMQLTANDESILDCSNSIYANQDLEIYLRERKVYSTKSEKY